MRAAESRDFREGKVAPCSLLGGVPALVESATALRRDVARAGGQRSSLQVVRVALPHESGVMPLRLRLGAAASTQGASAARV